LKIPSLFGLGIYYLFEFKPMFNWLDYLAVFQDSYTFRVLGDAKDLLLSILPGLISGLLVSSLLIAWWPLKQVQEWPLAHSRWALACMALFGVVSPFCSYLAIPIAAALITGGISPAPVCAFLGASPLMNPTLFAMTWSAFGWRMAVARTAAAFGFGFLCGVLALRYAEPLIRYIAQRSSQTQHLLPNSNSAIAFSRRWWNTFRHTGRFILNYVALGILVAAVLKEVIPIRWVEAVVGRGHGYGIIVGAMMGIPLYACGGGTIPLIQVLMDMGMSTGAALAFFIAGPATQVPFLTVLQLTMGTRVMVIFLVSSLIWAVGSGLIFQILT
jgi:uncharacterized protein